MAEDDVAKVEWLRAAAKVGFDQLDRGEGIGFDSMEDLDSYIHLIAEEASAEVAGENRESN